MRDLPEFSTDGLLPVGDFAMTLQELALSRLVRGESKPNWDTEWRNKLVTNLGAMVNQLWQVGISEIFVDGSFAEDKDHPNDIDGYFECDRKELASGRLEKSLNAIDPHKAWTWDPSERRSYLGYRKKQLPMWHVYRIEMYPHYGQLSGIREKHGHELEFPAAFRTSRSGKEKGIIKIVKEQT
ncbi:MAG: hypothetical protein AAGG48_26645 [Planctomycetota bacterium]